MKDKKGIYNVIIIMVSIIIILLNAIICILLNENKMIKEKIESISNNNIFDDIEDDSQIIDANNYMNQELSHEKTEEENVVNNEENDNAKICPQLNGQFYNIKTIMKEFRNNQNIKNYKDFEFDLDNDGIIDKVTLRHIVNEDEERYSNDRDYYRLEYDGELIYEHWYGLGSVGIVDLDSSDNFLEIWVYDDGPSDDPCYIFYRKVGNEMIEMGSFDVDIDFCVDGKGTMLAADRCMPWVEPTVFDSYYTIENNKFKKHDLDFSYNKNSEYYTSKELFFTTDLENIEKMQQDNSTIEDLIKKGEKYNIKKLDENTKFKVIEFVERKNEYDPQNLKIELIDGTKGYLIHPYGLFYVFD